METVSHNCQVIEKTCQRVRGLCKWSIKSNGPLGMRYGVVNLPLSCGPLLPLKVLPPLINSLWFCYSPHVLVSNGLQKQSPSETGHLVPRWLSCLWKVKWFGFARRSLSPGTVLEKLNSLPYFHFAFSVLCSQFIVWDFRFLLPATGLYWALWTLLLWNCKSKYSAFFYKLPWSLRYFFFNCCDKTPRQKNLVKGSI